MFPVCLVICTNWVNQWFCVCTIMWLDEWKEEGAVLTCQNCSYTHCNSHMFMTRPKVYGHNMFPIMLNVFVQPYRIVSDLCVYALIEFFFFSYFS